MNKFLIFLAATGIVFCLSSCYWFSQKKITGNGDLTEDTRQLNPFHLLSVRGDFEVDIRHSNESYAVISAESNLMDYILTTSRGGFLSIESKRDVRLNPKKDIKITLYTPSLESLEMLGSGSIVTEFSSDEKVEIALNGSGSIYASLNTYQLVAHLNGSGNIRVAGEGANATYNVNGSGNILAADFLVQAADAKIAGSGSVHCHASEELRARVMGSGDIVYRGNPQVSQNIKGSGSVRGE
ncbi:MAG: DUF2807 domain-containing protein [Saprospirales bacterium]|nr:MAG: DUF2807 domain-containing protein [Saprospirales bacterium]